MLQGCGTLVPLLRDDGEQRAKLRGEAVAVVVLKRSMATGYSGVDNPLFSLDNVRMLFGDAKAMTESIVQSLG